MAAIRTITLTAVVALSTGCATITRSPKETLYIDSTPPGATVVVTTKTGTLGQCVTPCSMEAKRKEDLTLTASLDGYITTEKYVWSKVWKGGGNVAVLGNVLAGGVIGIGIDAATGAGKTLKPNPASIYLYPVGTGDQPAPAPEAPETL